MILYKKTYLRVCIKYLSELNGRRKPLWYSENPFWFDVYSVIGHFVSSHSIVIYAKMPNVNYACVYYLLCKCHSIIILLTFVRMTFQIRDTYTNTLVKINSVFYVFWSRNLVKNYRNWYTFHRFINWNKIFGEI